MLTVSLYAKSGARRHDDTVHRTMTLEFANTPFSIGTRARRLSSRSHAFGCRLGIFFALQAQT